MQYYFQDYLFNSDQLTLFKVGEIVKLRPNEAKLLMLLLSDVNKVFSKGEIFDKVWTNKVVTEQTIFQNISRLRAIFGDSAIVNHPKKGYQWKLPLMTGQGAATNHNSHVQNQAEQTHHKRIDTVSSELTVNKKGIYYYTGFIFLLLTVTVYFLMPKSQKASNILPLNLVVMPINSTINTIDQAQIYAALQNTAEQSLSYIHHEEKTLTYRNIDANLEYIKASKLAHYKSDVLLLLDISSTYQQLFLRYRLVGNNFHWYGELTANDLTQLVTELNQQVALIYQAKIFAFKAPSLENVHAKLQALSKEAPNNLSVSHRLILSHIKLKNLTQALIIAKKMAVVAEQQNAPSYIAIALSLEGIIYNLQRFLNKSKDSFLSAQEIYTEYNDEQGLMNLAFTQAQVSAKIVDYDHVQAKLLEVINYTENIGDYKQKFNSYLFLSILAFQHNQLDDQDRFFALANKTFKDNFYVPAAEINLSFYSIIRNKMDKQLQIKQLENVLKMSKQYPQIPSFYQTEVKSLLIPRYIRNKQFDSALALFDFKQPLTFQEKRLLAIVYHRQGDTPKAINYAKEAFNEAVLANYSKEALNAALMLVRWHKVAEHQETIHLEFYIKYIEDNCNGNWIKANRQKILRINNSKLVNLLNNRLEVLPKNSEIDSEN